MTGSREGFGNDKPLWKQRRGHLPQFPNHKATEKENSSKNLRKTKEKERAKNQAVTCNPSFTRCNLYLNMVLNAIYYFPMMYGYPMMFE